MLATNLKVSGVPVFSIGDFEGEGAETILLEDEGSAAYRKLVLRDDRLAGACWSAIPPTRSGIAT